jgi:hypothetical protein
LGGFNSVGIHRGLGWKHDVIGRGMNLNCVRFIRVVADSAQANHREIHRVISQSVTKWKTKHCLVQRLEWNLDGIYDAYGRELKYTHSGIELRPLCICGIRAQVAKIA